MVLLLLHLISIYKHCVISNLCLELQLVIVTNIRQRKSTQEGPDLYQEQYLHP